MNWLSYSKFSKEEWQAIRRIVNYRSVVIKSTNNSLCVVAWDREDYTVKAEKHIRDVTIYKDVNFKEKMLQDLAERVALH